MKTVDFIRLVNEMREAQKDYFKNRSVDALKRAKNLEFQVDEIVHKSMSATA